MERPTGLAGETQPSEQPFGAFLFQGMYLNLLNNVSKGGKETPYHGIGKQNKSVGRSRRIRHCELLDVPAIHCPIGSRKRSGCFGDRNSHQSREKGSCWRSLQDGSIYPGPE